MSRRHALKLKLGLWVAMGVVVLGVVLAVAHGLGDTEQASSVAASAGLSSSLDNLTPPGTPATATSINPADASVPNGDVLSKKKLSDAIAAARPFMHDTLDKLDEGSALLALWAASHLEWSELQSLAGTSPAFFQKDPEGERGKRMCATGVITEIRVERDLGHRLMSDHPIPMPNVLELSELSEKPSNGQAMSDAGLMGEASTKTQHWDVPSGKVAFALITVHTINGSQEKRDAGAPIVIAAVAVGDSGKLVDNDTAGVCGVLTGVTNVTSTQEGSGTVLAHRVVGMFDLPGNHGPRSAKAPEGSHHS